MQRQNPEANQEMIHIKPLSLLRRLGQWLIKPLTRTLMVSGVFPAQAISYFKKNTWLKSKIDAFASKRGLELRSAQEIWEQNFSANLLSAPSPQANYFIAENLIRNKSKTVYINSHKERVSLDTFSFEDSDFSKLDPSQQCYRVHVSGNTGNCSRFFPELATLSKQNPTLKTITYNHPGVEGSDNATTYNQDSLIEAAFVQVKTLLDKGIAGKNITLSGFSIGAATSTHSHAMIQKLEKAKINIFAATTFNNMADVVTTKIAKGFRAIKNFIVKPLLWLTNWNMKPDAAFHPIEPYRRALTVIKPRKSGNKNGDRTITPAVSLFASTLPSYKKAKENVLILKTTPNLSDPKSKEALNELKQDANNAITHHAVMRLLEEKNSPEQETDLINLAIIGLKSQRLEGTDEADAHNVTADKIMSRTIHGAKWFKPNETYQQMVAGALRASHLPEQNDLTQISALTYYSMFNQAVKTNHSFPMPSISKVNNPTENRVNTISKEEKLILSQRYML